MVQHAATAPAAQPTSRPLAAAPTARSPASLPNPKSKPSRRNDGRRCGAGGDPSGERGATCRARDGGRGAGGGACGRGRPVSFHASDGVRVDRAFWGEGERGALHMRASEATTWTRVHARLAVNLAACTLQDIRRQLRERHSGGGRVSGTSSSITTSPPALGAGRRPGFRSTCVLD
jgi:hypothetical protein